MGVKTRSLMKIIQIINENDAVDVNDSQKP